MDDISEELNPPQDHIELISHLSREFQRPSNVDGVYEGQYAEIDRLTYAPGFITCPGILIKKANSKLSLLHLTIPEFDAFRQGKLPQRPLIDVNEVLQDIKVSTEIVIVSAYGFKGFNPTERLAEITKVRNTINGLGGLNIRPILINTHQFDLVLTPTKQSIWIGTQFIQVI